MTLVYYNFRKGIKYIVYIYFTVSLEIKNEISLECPTIKKTIVVILFD